MWDRLGAVQDCLKLVPRGDRIVRKDKLLTDVQSRERTQLRIPFPSKALDATGVDDIRRDDGIHFV
jgi:hypothetical protein